MALETDPKCGPNIFYCKYILLGIVIIFSDQLWVVYYHFSITAHVQGKFITDFYLVRYGYLYPDTQADLVIESYNNNKDQLGQCF